MYSQAPTSFPAQRPVLYGAAFQSRRRGKGANVLRNLKNAKFEDLGVFFAVLSIFAKVQFEVMLNHTGIDTLLN